MKKQNRKGKPVAIDLCQIRIYKRLMPEIKTLAALKGWSLVEATSVLISEALKIRYVNAKKVESVINGNKAAQRS